MAEVEWSSGIEAAEMYERVLVPALFDRWVDLVLEAGEVADGDRVLDVACGTGVVARRAVNLAGKTGRVVGIDIDEPMLDVAQRLGPGVDWRIGDAMDLPFADESFDVVICQAGLMFFPDQIQAVSEMARVLRSGGRAVFHVWAECEAQSRFAHILENHAGKESANNYRTPWNLADSQEVRDLVRAGGFQNPQLTTIQDDAEYSSVEMFLEGATGILTPSGINTEALRHDTMTALTEYIRFDGALVFPEPAHIITATKT